MHKTLTMEKQQIPKPTVPVVLKGCKKGCGANKDENDSATNANEPSGNFPQVHSTYAGTLQTRVSKRGTYRMRDMVSRIRALLLGL